MSVFCSFSDSQRIFVGVFMLNIPLLYQKFEETALNFLFIFLSTYIRVSLKNFPSHNVEKVRNAKLCN